MSAQEQVVVTVNGWLLDMSPDEAHDAVCWPPHPRDRASETDGAA